MSLAKKRPSKAAIPAPGSTVKISAKSNADAYLLAAPKTKFPAGIRPMLATLVDKPVDAEGWSYEIKWDGYRALAFINKGEVELRSRNDKSFNDKFYSLYNAILKWDIQAVIDGEIVVLGDNGVSDFGALQNWRSEADGALIFYAFDILWLNGKDLTKLPLYQRREILKAHLPASDLIRLSDTFDEAGDVFYQAAVKIGLEGIIAKKKDSLYHPDTRSKEWLKIKASKRQEVVIGGYTQ
jgi:bifunctional non-homologous end joining protein LigD